VRIDDDDDDDDKLRVNNGWSERVYQAKHLAMHQQQRALFIALK